MSEETYYLHALLHNSSKVEMKMISRVFKQSSLLITIYLAFMLALVIISEKTSTCYQLNYLITELFILCPIFVRVPFLAVELPQKEQIQM
jgi:hypothetical protein